MTKRDDEDSATDAVEDVPEAGGPTMEPGETPVDRGGALPHTQASDDVVEDASEESFPASDPPAYSGTT